MVFAKRLREGVKRGVIRCSIRIWQRPQVKAGGSAITPALARESGFESVADLLAVAKHGRGTKVYLIRFHYLPPGAWERTV